MGTAPRQRQPGMELHSRRSQRKHPHAGAGTGFLPSRHGDIRVVHPAARSGVGALSPICPSRRSASSSACPSPIAALKLQAPTRIEVGSQFKRDGRPGGFGRQRHRRQHPGTRHAAGWLRQTDMAGGEARPCPRARPILWRLWARPAGQGRILVEELISGRRAQLPVTLAAADASPLAGAVRESKPVDVVREDLLRPFLSGSQKGRPARADPAG